MMKVATFERPQSNGSHTQPLWGFSLAHFWGTLLA